MSELFDDDANDPQTTRTAPRRSRALLLTAVVLVLVIFGLTGFASIYTDRLWYRSAGYGDVFSKLLWTKIGLFAVFGVLMGGAVAVNIYLAYRFRPLFAPTTRDQSNLARYRDILTPIRTWVVVGVAVVVGAFAGTSGMGHWRNYLLWRNAESFGSDDAYFGKDIGFYVFHLPWWHFVVDFTMAACVLALIAAVAVQYLYGGIRLQDPQDRFSGPAQVQISVLLGLFVLAKAVDYYLDRFDLVTKQNSLFTGMNYTADKAILPAKNILLGVAVICAILFFANVWRRTWQLPTVGLALMVLSAILLGAIWPAIVQQFQVNPSEADKEAPYIQANIDATRDAYDLGGVESEAYSPSTSPGNPSAAFQGLLSSVPVVDPGIVAPAFENIQQERAYYSVPDVLDVDRYDIEGNDRALVLGLREIDQSRLSDDARNWSNLHTVYTHGNGVIAAYANQRDAANAIQDDTSGEDDSSASGRLEWAQGINSGEDDLSTALGDFESRIYYGELSPDYSVVGKADGGNDVELNLQTPGSDLGDTTTFDGPGDASVGSAFNQAMFAIKFGEPNFLLSGRVNDNSKVLFDRTPRDRVEKVAPWLTVDSDAYPAVVDNRVTWILDGYTTTDQFPNAQSESFESMIEDALQVDTGIQTVPTDEINYMRNAVKATVDAYTGEVTLYAWNEDDPILKTWMSAFPGTVQPMSDMSADLMEHVRYPEDLFKVQRYQYARYHVEDASDWYENNDRWVVPTDPQDPGTFQAPYRLFVQDAEQPDSAFSLSSVYVPFGRANLASFVSVNSDATADDYGILKVLEVEGSDEDSEGDEQIQGPGQVANEFQSNSDVRSELLDFTNSNSEAQVDFGNLLTLPVGDGLMYVQPVYVSRQAQGASYPELRRVLVKFGDDVAIGDTFQDALRNVLGSGTTTPTPTPDPDPDPDPNQGTGDQTLEEQLDAAVDDALAAFADAQSALDNQQLGLYQRKFEEANDLLTTISNLRDRIEARDGTGTPSDGATDTPSETPSTEPDSTPAAGN